MTDTVNRDRYKALDPDDMYGAVVSFPEQIRKAVEIVDKTEIDFTAFNQIDGIVLCGMGGSAIGGDLARSLLADRFAKPFTICRHYRLPAMVTSRTLVIGSSYSGGTEETLAAFDDGLSRGCPALVITTGGKLGGVADAQGIPRITIPGGLQPRAALGYSFVPLMLVLHKLGISPYSGHDCLELADFLEAYAEPFNAHNEGDDNTALRLAEKLYGRIPVIYSGPELTDTVGIRLKGQICENAKMLAFANQFPEFNHNEIVGWKVLSGFRDFLRVVILRDMADHPRVKARMDIVKGIIEKQRVDVFEVESTGQTPLQRMFSLVVLGDYTSYYLAMLNKINPTPVENIEMLKEELAGIK